MWYFWDLTHLKMSLVYTCTWIIVYLAGFKIVSFQNLVGIVPCFLASMLLLRSPSEFRILTLCKWQVFFSLAACDTLYLSLILWNFTMTDLVWVFCPLCRMFTGLSHPSIWQTVLVNFMFSCFCSGTPSIWVFDLLAWSGNFLSFHFNFPPLLCFKGDSFIVEAPLSSLVNYQSQFQELFPILWVFLLCESCSCNRDLICFMRILMSF